ncbi:CBS domain-containing protein CBSX2, chloroplastic-like isoform X2 [Quercus lobata]|uniref:CBS domain-containing protein CBSX2, chloroplastic-like isoform X2 n=1 Tax=Quercus lobata TaxID=97700 RepID=UPI001245E672|nr:CBS domain-containing protein CBSX2, chloroplastic-like isoform X2 [Quercus lobata]
MNSISLPNSQLLTPWPNSLLLHYPNHFPSSSSSIFPSYTYTPPSSLATPSLSKRRRFHFSAGGGRLVVSALSGVGVTNSIPPRGGTYTVGDFMTKKEELHVVKPTTTVEEALDALVEKRITGFPVIDDQWKLTFNEIQKLIGKNNGKVVGDLMTPAPLVVRESTNLEDAARLLLETKYRRLPVVDGDGKLVGIITRGNVVRAALQIKRASEKST